MKTLRLSLIATSLSLIVLFSFFSTPLFATTSQQETPPAEGRIIGNANLRSGPGTTFPIASSAKAGDLVEIAGCNDACDWYELADGKWIAAFLIEDIADSTSSVITATTTTTNTVTTTATTTTSVKTASASGAGNLRSGPGTTYDRVGSVQSGQTLEITGQNIAGDWLQLSDGKWIAAFLVANVPANLAVVESPTASQPAAAESTAATPEITLEVVTTAWQEGNDLNVPQSCGHFEYKITDVRRKKSLWFYNREYIAQGEWLLVFVEAKNISSGTSYLGNGSPRLSLLTVDGMYASGTGDSKASSYASWMFQHGRFYEDINPGRVLGMVEAYDLPLEPDMLLAFGMKECPDKLLSLGVWSNIQQPDQK